MITALDDIDEAVSCIKNGAFDFLTKPIDKNRFALTIKNAIQSGTLLP